MSHYIYFLFLKSELVYIGCSGDVKKRIASHTHKEFDSHRIMGPYEMKFAYDHEFALIKKYKPYLNMTGKGGPKKVPLNAYISEDRKIRIQEKARELKWGVSTLIEDAIEKQYGI